MNYLNTSWKSPFFLFLLLSHSFCKLLTTSSLNWNTPQGSIQNLSDALVQQKFEDSKKIHLGNDAELEKDDGQFTEDLKISATGSVRTKPAPALCRGAIGSLTGYIKLKPSKSLFFWFFGANKKPENAPLVLWLGGGPGASSVAGAFQENGPCRIRKDSSGFETNKDPWNDNANVLYIDQPVGVGYSYGTVNVTNTIDAVADVYDALQLFLKSRMFSKFKGRPFGLWTESYGGRYGPVLVDYILKKNSQITSHRLPGGIFIPVNSLGIGNGLVSPVLQYESYFSYAKSNPYKKNLANDTVIKSATQLFFKPGGCRDAIFKCERKPSPVLCLSAQEICNNILGLLVGNRNPYDIRVVSPSKYPPAVDPILNNPTFKGQIGVSQKVEYSFISSVVFQNFLLAGDMAKTTVPYLESILKAGVKTLLYVGDADFIVNYQGVEAMITKLNTKVTQDFSKTKFSSWIVDGQRAGVYKSMGHFNYLRVFEAGHQVPAYGNGKLTPGRASKVFFEQMIQSGKLQKRNFPLCKPETTHKLKLKH